MRFPIVFFLSGHQRRTGGDVVQDRLTGIHCHPPTLKYSTTGVPFVFPSGESYRALMCAPSWYAALSTLQTLSLNLSRVSSSHLPSNDMSRDGRTTRTSIVCASGGGGRVRCSGAMRKSGSSLSTLTVERKYANGPTSPINPPTSSSR